MLSIASSMSFAELVNRALHLGMALSYVMLFVLVVLLGLAFMVIASSAFIAVVAIVLDKITQGVNDLQGNNQQDNSYQSSLGGKI